MNIVVLCGGVSSERDVSLSSGTGVAAALRSLGHRVLLLDLYLGRPGPLGDPETVFGDGSGTGGGQRVGERSPDLAAVKALRPDARGLLGPNVAELCMAADLVFMALHGAEGENGKVQGFLDLCGVKYTGTGALGAALAMDKSVSKALFRATGIPTPQGLLLRRGEPVPELPWLPCVVKPCSGGSSVGTSVVRRREELLPALDLAFACEDCVLVEEFVSGRELTVGVMDGRALPPVEVVPRGGFYDYASKYQPGATEDLCPAPVGERLTRRAQELAVRVGEALHLEVYYRVDLLWDTAADRLFCLEANTLPGMTPTSLVPMMAAAEGMSYGELCETIMKVSLKKYS